MNLKLQAGENWGNNLSDMLENTINKKIVSPRKDLDFCVYSPRRLAFTDAVWRKENPPPAVKVSFDLDYPAMGWLDGNLAAIQDCGFDLIGHFTLPDEAWWDDFYTPMEARITELRGKYVEDAEVLAILDRLAEEPEMHRRHSEFYAYEFFVACRPALRKTVNMKRSNRK